MKTKAAAASRRRPARKRSGDGPRESFNQDLDDEIPF